MDKVGERIDDAPIDVMVCYGRTGAPRLIPLRVAPGTTLQQAVEASGILAQCPELDPVKMRTGIYGKLRPLDTPLHDRDRIEIYQPLLADPKTARRKRVEAQREAVRESRRRRQ